MSLNRFILPPDRKDQTHTHAVQYGDLPANTHVPDIMTASEIAAYLRISLKTVYSLSPVRYPA
jgi:hypothetical protein